MSAFTHRIAWELLRYTYTSFIRFKYHCKVHWHTPKPGKHFLFLANHNNITDPFYMGNFLKPVCYMANEEGFTGPVKNFFSYWIGTFPKKKGDMDLGAVKEMFKRLRANRNVGLFPEGDRSWDGETRTLDKTIVKLIRKADVPVLIGRSVGAYLTRARWMETSRVGQIDIHFNTITLEEIQTMDEDQLLQRIQSHMYTNDIKECQKRAIPFTGKRLAHGVEYILWICPKCGKHDTIIGKDDTILCSHCHATWTLNSYLSISPTDIQGSDLKDWMDWQGQQTKRLIASTPDDAVITESYPFFMHDPEASASTPPPKGRLTLTRSHLRFYPDKTSTSTTSPQVIEMEIPSIQYAVIGLTHNLNIGFHGKNIMFTLEKKQNHSKWVYLIKELLHK